MKLSPVLTDDAGKGIYLIEVCFVSTYDTNYTSFSSAKLEKSVQELSYYFLHNAWHTETA